MNAELANARWYKSSRSGAGKECVEIAHLNAGHVGIRDSKNPTGPALVFSPTTWDVFLTNTK